LALSPPKQYQLSTSVTLAMAKKRVYFGEFVGTFLLMFTVGCDVLSGTDAAGGSIGCALMVGIYALAKVSGAHFNPAVSVALGIADKLPWAEVVAYSVVQLVAGALAGMLAKVMFRESEHTLALGPAEGFSWWQAGVCELLYTFMLCTAVLHTACSAAAAKANAQFYGLSIGLVIVAGAYGAGAVSGGCFNPAVALGVYTGGNHNSDTLRYLPIYVFFQLVGAGLATFVFKKVRPAKFEAGKKGAELQAKVISEFLGTYMLVVTIGLNVLAGSVAGPFSIAAALIVMVFALGDVSGGHFNPAVTIAILSIGKIQVKEAVIYWVTQVVGGLLGAVTYTVIYGGKRFVLGPNKPFGLPETAVAEAFFTFVLCFVVLSVACSPSADSHSYTQIYGLAIGSCIIVGGVAIGSISGGSLNPAVSIATFAMAGMNSQMHSVLYIVFELLGAGVAVLLYFQTHEDVALCAAELSDSDSEESDTERPKA